MSLNPFIHIRIKCKIKKLKVLCLEIINFCCEVALLEHLQLGIISACAPHSILFVDI